MKKLVWGFGLIILSVNFLVTAGTALNLDNLTRQSYERARLMVESSLEAMGAARSGKLDSISFKASGTLYARNQSLKPDTTYDPFPVVTTVFIDLKQERVIWEQDNELPGGIRFANRIALKQDGGFNLNLLTKNHTKLPANAPIRSLAYRMVPLLLLQKAMEQKFSLRWMGEAESEGKKQSLTSFNWNNFEYTLYFDTASKLLTKYEFLSPDAWAGDDVGEVHYFDYRSFEGLVLPTGMKQVRAGGAVRESKYTDYKFNAPRPDSEFQLPTDYPAAAVLPPSVKTLSKDVYMIEGLAGGGYKAMFIAFNDHVMVIEAPGNSQVSSFVINKIKETVPGKPIKYVVLTHYHDDHTGGLRPYVAEGAQIITTAGNRNFVEQIAKARYTLTPDALSRKPQAPNFLFVDKQQKFSDGDREVVIYNIGPTPHVADMHIVWLPKEKILYQADMYNMPTTGLVNKTTVHLVKQIEKLGLEVTTVVGAHNNATPFAQVKAEVEAFSAKAQVTSTRLTNKHKAPGSRGVGGEDNVR